MWDPHLFRFSSNIRIKEMRNTFLIVLHKYPYKLCLNMKPKTTRLEYFCRFKNYRLKYIFSLLNYLFISLWSLNIFFLSLSPQVSNSLYISHFLDISSIWLNSWYVHSELMWHMHRLVWYGPEDIIWIT